GVYRLSDWPLRAEARAIQRLVAADRDPGLTGDECEGPLPGRRLDARRRTFHDRDPWILCAADRIRDRRLQRAGGDAGECLERDFRRMDGSCALHSPRDEPYLEPRDPVQTGDPGRGMDVLTRGGT